MEIKFNVEHSVRREIVTIADKSAAHEQ